MTTLISNPIIIVGWWVYTIACALVVRYKWSNIKVRPELLRLWWMGPTIMTIMKASYGVLPEMQHMSEIGARTFTMFAMGGVFFAIWIVWAFRGYGIILYLSPLSLNLFRPIIPERFRTSLLQMACAPPWKFWWVLPLVIVGLYVALGLLAWREVASILR